MKRNTRVDKPNRGPQPDFSQQYANSLKENRRLRDECASRIESVKRKAAADVDAARAERDEALGAELTMQESLALYVDQHRDFARAASVLRSRSILRRLWWGIRFGFWGVFGYES